MWHWRVYALVVLVILTGLASHASASVRSYRDLSREETRALQVSKSQLAQLDAALQTLERYRQRRKISANDYAAQERALMVLISAESNLQNGILIRPRGMSEDTRELLNNIARYSVLVPAYILAYAAENYHGSFSP